MSLALEQTQTCAELAQPGRKLEPLPAAAGAPEDEESAPSTEFGSDAASESDCSDEDCADDLASPFSVEDTMLIFDWDNTMLPTTWLEEQGLGLDRHSEPTQAQREQLREMAEHARQTLQIAKTHGKVVLVTNAEHGWVELSCKKFLPELCASLEGVKILSARSTYERQGVQQPAEWKYLAFESEVDDFIRDDRHKNIISIGDSPHERQALIRVAERLPDSRAKALKLMERPGLGQLVREHQLIGGCLRDIVRYDGSLDLCIQRP